MFALLSIGWFIAVILSITIVFSLIGFSGLTSMFPEGKRAWHLPAQLASLVVFALVVLYNPFITWSVR